MPPAPLIPHLGYASLLSFPASQRERQRRRRGAWLLLASLATCYCLFLLLSVVGRAGRGGEEGGRRHLREEEAKAKAAAATTATATTTAAASSASPLSPPRLTPLQRRLLQPQQPTHDLSGDGGIGRVERVAAARLLAVEAELSRRRKQREEEGEGEGEGEEHSSPRRRHKRGGGNDHAPDPSSSSSPLSPPPPPPPPPPPRPPRPASDPSYVAVCVVVKDQNDDLPEFVAWHAALGVRTFYLYDDRSAAPVTPELARSLLPKEESRASSASSSSASSSSGSSSSSSSSSSLSSSSASSSSPSSSSPVSVHVTRLTEEAVQAHPARRPQLAAYDDCSLSRRGSHSWLAFLDVDEFVAIEEGDETDGGETTEEEVLASLLLSAEERLPSLPALLSRFEAANAAAVLLHWRIFGSSGRTTSKPRNITTAEAFTSCLGANESENAHVKTIARTALLDVAEPCLGPHHFSFWDLKGAVDKLERQEIEMEEGGVEKLQAEEEEGEGEEEASKRKEERDSFLGISGRPNSTELFLSPSAPYPVDVRGKRLDGPVAGDLDKTAPPFSPAFLAHYAIKSREDYGKKIERGSAMGNRKSWEFFGRVDSRTRGDASGGCLGAKRLARKMREAGALALPR